MTGLLSVVLVGAGGAVGAVARHLVGEVLQIDGFPVATFVVNVIGSFMLAVVTFATVDGQLGLIVGTGVCGAFTTYSSFSFETVRMSETGAHRRSLLYALGTLTAALFAVGTGWALVQLL